MLWLELGSRCYRDWEEYLNPDRICGGFCYSVMKIVFTFNRLRNWVACSMIWLVHLVQFSSYVSLNCSLVIILIFMCRIVSFWVFSVSLFVIQSGNRWQFQEDGIGIENQTCLLYVTMEPPSKLFLRWLFLIQNFLLYFFPLYLTG